MLRNTTFVFLCKVTEFSLHITKSELYLKILNRRCTVHNNFGYTVILNFISISCGFCSVKCIEPPPQKRNNEDFAMSRHHKKRNTKYRLEAKKRNLRD